jgi:ABC-type uncharacterized transport system permease subunit
VSGNVALSNPPLLGTTTVVALFQNGHNAIATNATGSVMGLNLFPDRFEAHIMRLIGNMIHELTGAW